MYVYNLNSISSFNLLRNITDDYLYYLNSYLIYYLSAYSIPSTKLDFLTNLRDQNTCYIIDSIF